jgi:hypothetical protein
VSNNLERREITLINPGFWRGLRTRLTFLLNSDCSYNIWCVFKKNWMLNLPQICKRFRHLKHLGEYNYKYKINSNSFWLTSSSNNPSRHIVTKCFILFISPEDVSFVSPESRSDNNWRKRFSSNLILCTPCFNTKTAFCPQSVFMYFALFLE